MLIYSMSVSVDGFIADREGAFGWTIPSDELFRFHTAQVRELGGYLLGRRLYETMLVAVHSFSESLRFLVMTPDPSPTHNRGTTSRGMLDGGAQERELVAKYSSLAEAIRDQWPRSGAVLTSLARTYEREARLK